MTAYAPKSKGPLNSALRAFAEFAECTPGRELFVTPQTRRDWSEWAIHAWNEWTLILWAVFMTQRASRKTGRPVKGDTVKQYASLLKGFFSLSYSFTIVGEAPKLRALLKQMVADDPLCGIRRKRRALQRRHLLKLWKHHGEVRGTHPDVVNLWAATVFAWISLARGGELGGGERPKRSDLTFGWDGRGRAYACVMLVPLKKKGSRPPPPVPQYILEHDGGGSDAYSALRRLVELDPVPLTRQSGTPLFRVARGRGGARVALSTSRFRSWIRHLASEVLGMGDKREWGAHSARIGGATDLASTGRMSRVLLMAKGRWASDIGQIYARMTRRAHLAASELMQRAKGRDLEELLPDFVQAA